MEETKGMGKTALVTLARLGMSMQQHKSTPLMMELEEIFKLIGSADTEGLFVNDKERQDLERDVLARMSAHVADLKARCESVIDGRRTIMQNHRQIEINAELLRQHEAAAVLSKLGDSPLTPLNKK